MIDGFSFVSRWSSRYNESVLIRLCVQARNGGRVMRRSYRHRLGAVVPLEARLAPAVLNFTLTQAQSSATLSGNINGSPVTQQGAGSLTATYTGGVQVDLDLTSNTINFINALEAAAANSGNWQPLPGGATGSAPANYGGRVIAFGVVFAVRDLRATASTAAPLTMTGNGSTRAFPSTQTTLAVTNGSLDYNAGILGMGTTSLVGNSGMNGAGTADGNFTDVMDGTGRLTAPIDVTFNTTVNGLPASYRIVGQWVGLSPFPIADLNGPGAGADTTLNFTGGAAAATIASAATVLRNPASNLDSMTVVLTNRPDGANEALNVDVSGSGLTSSGYDPSTGMLTISGAGSLAAYQSVLRTVTYRDALTNATAGNRAITVVVNDGVISSLAHTATVSVSPGVPVPAVTQTLVNGTTDLQRSRVTSLTIAFNSVVDFAGSVASAFTLTRDGGGAVGFSGSASNATGVTVVTLNAFTGAETNFGSLRDGRFTLTALASQISNASGQLNGGTNYTFGEAQGLFRFFGDVNGDRHVDIADFGIFSGTFNSHSNDPGFLAYLDFNGDGAIDIADFGQFSLRIFTPLP
jgi:Dockerin type I domain